MPEESVLLRREDGSHCDNKCTGWYLGSAQEIEGKDVEKELLLEVESGFNPMKKTGCWGLMQINPKVWKVKNNSIKALKF